MSLGGSDSTALQTIIKEAFDAGISIVAAAGDDNEEAMKAPCM